MRRAGPDDGLRIRHLVAVWLITAAVAVLAIDTRATVGARLTADEPQYLLSALSLAEDLDLDIADELADERFLPFHEIPLDPQTIALDERGTQLSPHDPLLPAVLAPAMGLGGWVGARLALAALAGTTAAITAWVAANRLGVSRRTTLVAVTGLFATPPLTTYGSQIYPEMAAALAVIVGVAGLTASHIDPSDHGANRMAPHPAMTTAAIVALPWLSVKYVPVAAMLALALLGANRHPDRRRTALTLAAVLAAAGAVYLVAHQRIYGGWTVYAAGDHFVDGEFGVVGTDPDYVGRSRRLVGLLVDRRFGLIPWAPAFVLLAPALGALGRRPWWPRTLLISVFGAGWATATWVALTMHGWWWPGRQVVAVLPVAVLAIAGLVDGRPRLVAATAGLSAAAMGNWLWLVVEASTGRRTLIVDFFETSAPLYRLLSPIFPDHMVDGAVDRVLTGGWLVALAVAGLVGWRAGHHPLPPPLIDQTAPEVDRRSPSEDLGHRADIGPGDHRVTR